MLVNQGHLTYPEFTIFFSDSADTTSGERVCALKLSMSSLSRNCTVDGTLKSIKPITWSWKVKWTVGLSLLEIINFQLRILKLMRWLKKANFVKSQSVISLQFKIEKNNLKVILIIYSEKYSYVYSVLD